MIELVLQIVSILAPGACLALIGIGWHLRGPDYPLGFVTVLVLNVCLPALLFHTLATAAVSLETLGTLAVASLTVHVAFAALVVAVLRVVGKDWRLSVAHVVGNTGNLGLPICLLAFGETGLAYAITFFAVQCVLMFSLGEAIYAGNLHPGRVLRSPILHAIWIGIAVRLLDVPVPGFAMQTVSLLGQVVVPLMLITLGVSLAEMRVESLPSSLLWSCVRTVFAIGVGFGVAALFGLDGVARGVLVIQTAMPVAVFNFLLAERHGRDSVEVSGLILVTHVGALFYLPVILGLILG